VEDRRYLSIRDALKELLRVEEKRKKLVVTEDTLVVGISRAGSCDPAVRAGLVRYLLNYDFAEPPHSLIFPGKLHFMEAEALRVLAGTPEK
jgi:diphthine synthase